MASQQITERPKEQVPARTAELAPSAMREENPDVARVVGFLSATLVIFCGTVLVLARSGLPNRYVGPFSASLLLMIGLAGLLYHAAFDNDIQFRRVYFLFSALALVLGAFLCVLPYPRIAGDQFGPGLLCMGLALLFVLAFLRNETDRQFRDLAQYGLGVAGGLFALVGMIGGMGWSTFLLPYGLLLSLLGLVYLIAFVSNRGISDDLAYWTGLGTGLLGLVIMVAALVRSIFPQLFQGDTGLAIGSYFVPHGVTLLCLGGLYLFVSVMQCSDSRLVALVRRELSSYFLSPIAYLVLIAFIIAHWLNFYFWVSAMNEKTEVGANQVIREPIVQHFFGLWQVIVVVFLMPALTMRLVSEEKRAGTLEVLLTTPVNEVQVVLSKFLAAFIMYLLVWVPYFLMFVSLRLGNSVDESKRAFDLLPLFSLAIALFVTGACFVSMGLFFSCLTRDQITSGVLTFVGMMALTAVHILKSMSMPRTATGESSLTGWPLILHHFSYIDLWFEAKRGVLVLRDMMFPITATVLFLFLSVKVLEARKWS